MTHFVLHMQHKVCNSPVTPEGRRLGLFALMRLTIDCHNDN
ncbi:MAG: hypothetical protein QOJ40_1523 [Verrucomicrobiota bacterium]